jgi:hypothetical protein
MCQKRSTISTSLHTNHTLDIQFMYGSPTRHSVTIWTLTSMVLALFNSCVTIHLACTMVASTVCVTIHVSCTFTPCMIIYLKNLA